ncbi:MAG: ABC transporter permease [Clostridia bacterium]|nr:ABC transporter permease [Clostridia bacterium]
MTLKSLFSKAFLTRFFRRFNQFNWLTALWSVYLFFAFPVAGALVFSVSRRENYWTVERVNSTLLIQLCFVCGAAILVAILTPNVFNYLNSRKQLDFYHSQPVTRKELFWRNYFVGWASFLLPLIAGFFTEIGIIMLLPGIAWDNFLLLFKGFFACIGTYFSVNALCILAVMLCGNRFISLITGVYLCGAPAMIFGMFWYYVENFSQTFTYTSQMYDILSGITPVSYMLDLIGFKESAKFFSNTMWWTVGWTAVSFGIVFLARFLYLRRKSETAGKPLSFPKAILFIKYPLTVFSAWVGGILFEAMGDENIIWLLFGFVTFGIITWCIVSGLEKFEFRNAFRGMWKLLVCGGVFLSFLLTLFAGTVVFDKRVTKDSNIISIDLSNLHYYETKDGGTQYSTYDSLHEIEGEEAIKALNTIIRQGAKQAVTGGIRSGNSVYTADLGEDSARISLNVTVNTKFGSYTRYYSFRCEPRSDMLKAVKAFANSEGAKKAYAEYALAQIDTKASHFTFRPSAKLPSAEKMEQVYNALAEDIKNSTPEDYSEPSLGTIDIYCSARFYSYQSSSEQRVATVPVYPSFEKTLALISASSLTPTSSDTVGVFSNTEHGYDANEDYAKGNKQGYDAGYEKGKLAASEDLPYKLPDLDEYRYSSQLYDQGFYDGFIIGYEEGYSVYGDPYTEGYNKGYEEGFSLGTADAEKGLDYTSPTYEYDGTSYSDGYYNGYCDGYNAGYYNEEE